MGELVDVTHFVDAYREAARHVWNTWLLPQIPRVGDDAVGHADCHLRWVLFNQLVLEEIDQGEDPRCGDDGWECSIPETPLAFLKVLPDLGGSPFHLYTRPLAQGGMSLGHARGDVDFGNGGFELEWIQVFDFIQFGFRDYTYFKVCVKRANNPDHVGCLALVPRLGWRVCFDPDDPSARKSR